MTTQQIFVTGGVVSSLGKGLTASSLGTLLRSRGLSVVMQKLDPYINVDPGTMNPFQHGEVFVTDDGGECDLDIGHYERFLDVPLSKDANATTGQIYSEVIAAERRGDYLGDTVQVIPHITDEIKRRMRAQASDDVDVIITEIGGTVGDIESLPFIEAARQVRQDLGRSNVAFVHISLVPYIAPSGELKTKPTQHSVAALRSYGIVPDALVLRSDRELPENLVKKIASACDVDLEATIPCPDSPSIYDIPKVLWREGLDVYLIRRLNLKFRDVNWSMWDDLLGRVHDPVDEVTIGLVGKYIDLPDAYLSVVQAIHHGGFANQVKAKIKWITADDVEADAEAALADVDGIVVPGGFGVRGVEGKLDALRYARENGVPTLGICLGMQAMVIEAARNLAGLQEATSTEFNEAAQHPVISTMAEQKAHLAGGDLGGTMRLGSYAADLTPGSLAHSVYGATEVTERHRHRYEVNSAYIPQLSEAGLTFSGVNPDTGLAEFVELSTLEHPYYIGTQAHPEFKSRPTAAHPLFARLVQAALNVKTL